MFQQKHNAETFLSEYDFQTVGNQCVIRNILSVPFYTKKEYITPNEYNLSGFIKRKGIHAGKMKESR